MNISRCSPVPLAIRNIKNRPNKMKRPSLAVIFLYTYVTRPYLALEGFLSMYKVAMMCEHNLTNWDDWLTNLERQITWDS